jgi:hypothetical protein
MTIFAVTGPTYTRLSSPASFAIAKRGKGTQALTAALVFGSLGSLPLAPLTRRSAGNDK